MPKLCFRRVAVSLALLVAHDHRPAWPRKRPRPPTMAWSSANLQVAAQLDELVDQAR
jgi:hypothetical protein